MAEGNWWGAAPPNPDCFSLGTVDYSPWLTSDPNDALYQERAHLVLKGMPARVEQNYPNPFIDVTSISYSVPRAGTRTVIQVFDVKGRVVRRLIDEQLDMGRHSITWDGFDDQGRALASGVYFIRVEIGDDFKETKKIILGR